MTYSTVALVSAYLGGVTIDDNSTVTSAQVSDWLDWSDSEIDRITGTKFVTGTVTDELRDYDGSGYLRTIKKPIISVTTMEYDANVLGNAPADWTALLEGRDNTDDFIVYPEEGKLFFHGGEPSIRFQSARISYTYGYATTPNLAIELATALTAQKFIKATLSKDVADSPSNISVGSISLSKNFTSTKFLTSLSEEIVGMTDRLGTLTIWRLL